MVLPYLDAVIMESLRYHPTNANPFLRTVSAEGLQLPEGRKLPPGTVVGMSGTDVHRNQKIFGEDAHDLKPRTLASELDGNGGTI